MGLRKAQGSYAGNADGAAAVKRSVNQQRSLVKPGFPWMAVVSILGSLAYGVSPVDLVPDLIPLLGFADDAVIAPLLLLIGGVILFRRYKPHGAKASPAPAGPPVIPDAQVIDVPARPVR